MFEETLFADRQEAGRRLAERLTGEVFSDPLILALPRGGVPVAFEIAKALGAPLDLLLVRKIGAPGQRELAMAAIADSPGSEMVVNRELVAALGISGEQLERAAEAERRELARRREAYLSGRPRPRLTERDLILVDDGVATGASIMAALKALKMLRPKRLIVALPVGPAESIAALEDMADRVICLAQPEPFFAIGPHYADFHQLSDAEVTRLLGEAEAFARRTD